MYPFAFYISQVRRCSDAMSTDGASPGEAMISRASCSGAWSGPRSIESLERLDHLDARDAAERRERLHSSRAADAARDRADRLAHLEVKDALLRAETLLHDLGTHHAQAHIVTAYADASKAEQTRLLQQISALDSSLGSGGLRAYISRGISLMKGSREGLTPLAGWTPSVAPGYRQVRTLFLISRCHMRFSVSLTHVSFCGTCLFFCGSLDLGSGDFEKYEGVGLSAVGRTAFVLVAGGLGERLGYSGIKLSLPAETLSAGPTAGVSTSTGMCYLELYIRQNVSIRVLVYTSHKPLLSPSLSVHRISPDSVPPGSFPPDSFPPDSSRPILPDSSRPILPA